MLRSERCEGESQNPLIKKCQNVDEYPSSSFLEPTFFPQAVHGAYISTKFVLVNLKLELSSNYVYITDSHARLSRNFHFIYRYI